MSTQRNNPGTTPLSHRDPVEMMAERGVAAAQAFFRKALGSTHPRVSRKVTLNGHVPSRRTMAAAPRALLLAQRKGPGEQVVEQPHRARPPRDQATLRVDRWIRIGPPHSQGTIFVRPWPSAPWLVAQGGMGDRTCMRERGSKLKRHSAGPKYPPMHQSQSFVASNHGGR
jgi:hypothetical protein